MKSYYILVLLINLFFINYSIEAQPYIDYVGTGHFNGITVSTSSSSSGTNGINTVNASGVTLDLKSASRFLGQSSIGYNYEHIEYVAQVGFESWLDWQFTFPVHSYELTEQDIYDTFENELQAIHGLDEEIYRGSFNFNRAFWQQQVTKNDVLRQRIAFALSEILVTSGVGGLEDRGEALACYYDVLYQNAFGNYRDILYKVTLSPAMGIYLSHLNNPKTDQANNIRPDENFAREVMQLFTIGLFELNDDGSYQTNPNGDAIPTYNNDDVKEFAKVFTGLSGSSWAVSSPSPVYFGNWHFAYSMCDPMAMYDYQHEPGPKYLLNGYVIPSGQNGMQDINNAIDHLFNHPNVGPFISKKLIQFLVRSNPTPAYISRVTAAFNDNGNGIRGDMKAVIKAILLDAEARDCASLDDPRSGKLKEPIIRVAQFVRAFDTENISGRYWHIDLWRSGGYLKQGVMHAPSVFNFFQPDYIPNGIIAQNNMVAPEFKIVDSNTGLAYMNMLDDSLLWSALWCNATASTDEVWLYSSPDDQVTIDLSDEMNILTSQGWNGLIDRLNIILCQGQLSNTTKNIIANAMAQIENNWGGIDPYYGVILTTYFVMSSPDYVITK